MNKYLCILCFGAITHLVGFAQPELSICPVDSLYEQSLLDEFISVEYHKRFVGFSGVHYFAPPSQGFLYMENGKVISGEYFQYDQCTDEMLWFRSEDLKPRVLPKELVKQCIWPNENYNFVKVSIKEGQQAKYLQLLEQGILSLYAYRRSVPDPDNRNALKEKTSYYVARANWVYPVRTARQSLLSLPGMDKKLLKYILRHYHLQLKEGGEPDLIIALRYYNRTLASAK